MTLTKDDIKTNFNHNDLADVQDPYPFFDEARSKCPLGYTDSNGGYFFTLDYESTKRAYSDWQAFTSTQDNSIPDMGVRMIPVHYDPPLQTKYRRILRRYFSEENAEAYRSRIEEIANDLIDDFIESGEADFANQLTRPTLTTSMFTMIGIPSEKQEYMRDLLEWMTANVANDPEGFVEKNNEFARAILGIIAERRESPPVDDLIQVIFEGDIDGEPLTDVNVFEVLYVTLLGALDSSHATMSEALLHLAKNPEDKQRLISGDVPWATAIEEFVRYASPIQLLARTAVEDVELSGVSIPAGTKIGMLAGAANRDPEKFDNPHQCIVSREIKEHLGFGWGAHVCLGKFYARVMIEEVLSLVLQRMPDIEVSPGFEPAYTAGVARAMTSLKMRFTPGKKLK